MSGANMAGVALGVTPLSVYSGRQIKPRATRISIASQRVEPFAATPPEWMNVAKPCDSMEFGTAWDLDFHAPSDAVRADEYAAELCAGCPVLETCLETALSEEGTTTGRNRYLIRGGLTPNRRAELAASRRVCSQGHEGHWSAEESRCLECKRELVRKAS